jgi:hypothetical protein
MRPTLLPLLLLAACAPSAPSARREPLSDVPFDARQYARYTERGTASLHGAAFVKLGGGRVNRIGGQRVYLTPVTGVSTALVEEALETQAPFTPSDPRVAPLTREAVTDADGRFLLEGLPAGDYFVVTTFAGALRPRPRHELRARPPVVVTARLALAPGQAVELHLVAD